MKVEHTNKMPKFNLLQPDGVRPQTHSQNVSHVLLNDGHWYAIVPGSFKFYRTDATEGPGVPFVQFDIDNDLDNDEMLVGKRVEVFPASVCGLAYTPDEGNKEADR